MKHANDNGAPANAGARAYYNEIDPKAAAWLRELINQGHIAPGVVDERSIVDVQPADLLGYAQCHFFAGIGVWSHALRRAGWSDSKSVWTGSCPCQPFSAAGKGGGFDDERHLWPHFYWLISQCRPAVVAGEQVASKDADPWIDLVQSDLEALGYAFGATPFPSAGVGAPHIRDRLYWVAEGMGHAEVRRESGGAWERQSPKWSASEAGRRGATIGLADTDGWNASNDNLQRSGQHGQQSQDGLSGGAGDQGIGHRADSELRPGPTNGLWGDVDWLFCRDGKWRPVEPGTFPLANGAPSRVGRLRGYGNAINAEAATVFIEAYLESREQVAPALAHPTTIQEAA